MAATIDSGTETLFSDESPCELVGSPSVCSGDDTEVQPEDTQSVNGRLAPPNIQPYSGVLEKGKVVIRPIAFKPSAMTPSARFGMCGERYGSTPILTRPGSRLTLYGSSNDLHQQNINNYSLDRKLRSSCPSASSSSPLALTSLSSLPHNHKLINYDSLESVRKSPVSNNGNKNYRLISGGSLMDLTPSPSDSGVSELEAALRDRDSELAYLRQTMEHNEQVIFRVYQEKEKVWERELKKLKTVQETRLRTSAQKVLKLEQMLMMQTYQMQQDKKRLCVELQKTNMQNERLKQEVAVLRGRLEETEWGAVPEDRGDFFAQDAVEGNDQTNKCQELLQIRTDYRDLREQLNDRDREIEKFQTSQALKDLEISDLKEEIKKLKSQQFPVSPAYDSLGSIVENSSDVSETERLKAEIRELREELSDMSLNDYSGIEPGRAQRGTGQIIAPEDSLEDLEIQKLNGVLSESIYSNSEMEKLKQELEYRTKQFENERLIWAQEKEKVLRYQRQLQMNYVQMFRRTRVLEAEIQNLTIELELDKTGVKKKLDMSQTIEL
ncbi:hypothetical protein NQ315_003142 [Exocentrus adspersus]|uniref:Leucine zipper tumor suppressor 2 homolog n=1 Tax=Exocentrus adspersus TaxID=1586481 RepID=A0AAV8W5A3_9CUCU|nr:hypothetical protein NQ315_003142 [Exocentrus adspersus]